MKIYWLSLACWLGLVGAAPLAAAESFDEGIEYKLIVPPQPTGNPNKVEVVELFWYGCPHCHQLEPILSGWEAEKPEYVEFVRMPAVLGPRWELLARAYYTAELLGVLDKIHGPLFHALHVEKQRINTVEGVAAFFAKQGVPEEEFEKTFNSFAVATRLNQARLMSQRYGITGVPTLVINGKYRTQASMTGGNERMMKVVDYLAAQEYQASTIADTDR